MPQPKECPKCETINPPDAQVCDCGYVFSATGDAAEYARQTKRMLISGAVVTALGVGAILFFEVVEKPPIGLRLEWGWLLAGPLLFLGGLKRLTRKPH